MRFAGIVRMRYHQRDVDAMRQQDLEAADADILVGEDDGASHVAAVLSTLACASRLSSTARMVKRGRSRTCW